MADDVKVTIKAEDKVSDVLDEIKESAEDVNEAARTSANRTKQAVDKVTESYDQLLAGAHKAASELLVVTKQVVEGNKKLNELDTAREGAEFEDFTKIDNEYEDLNETVEKLNETQEKLFKGMREGLLKVNGYVEKTEDSFSDAGDTILDKMSKVLSTFESEQMELDKAQGIRDINSLILALENLQGAAKGSGKTVSKNIDTAAESTQDAAKKLLNAVDEVDDKAEGALTDLANEFGENLPNQIKEFVGHMQKAEQAAIDLNKATSAEADNEDGRKKKKLINELIGAEDRHKKVMKEQTNLAKGLGDAISSYANPLRDNVGLTEQQVKALSKLSVLIYALRGSGASVMSDMKFDDSAEEALGALKGIFGEQKKVEKVTEKVEEEQEKVSEAAEGTLHLYKEMIGVMKAGLSVQGSHAMKFSKTSEDQSKEKDGRKLRKLNRELEEATKNLNNSFVQEKESINNVFNAFASLVQLYEKGEVTSDEFKQSLDELGDSNKLLGVYMEKMEETLAGPAGAQYNKRLKETKVLLTQLANGYKAVNKLISGTGAGAPGGKPGGGDPPGDDDAKKKSIQKSEELKRITEQQIRLEKAANEQRENIKRQSEQRGPLASESKKIREVAEEGQKAADRFTEARENIVAIGKNLDDVKKTQKSITFEVEKQVELESHLKKSSDDVSKRSLQRGPNMLQNVQIEGAAQATRIATEKMAKDFENARKAAKQVAEEQEKVAEVTEQVTKEEKKSTDVVRQKGRIIDGIVQSSDKVQEKLRKEKNEISEQLALQDKKSQELQKQIDQAEEMERKRKKDWAADNARVKTQVAASDRGVRLARQELQLKLKMRSITDIDEVTKLANEYDAVGDGLQLIFANFKKATSEKEKFHKGKKSKEAQRLKQILENLKSTFLLTKNVDFGFDKMHKLATEFQNIEGATHQILQTYDALNKKQDTWNKKVESGAKSQEKAATSKRQKEFDDALKSTDIGTEKDVENIVGKFHGVANAHEKAMEKMTRTQKDKVAQDKKNTAAAERLRKELSTLPGTINHLDSAMSKINVQFYTYTNILQDARFGVQEFARHMREATGGLIKSGAQFETFERGLRIVESGAHAAQIRLSELLDISDRLVGLETTALIKYSNQLRAASVSAKDANMVIIAVAKSLSEMGKGTIEAERVLRQLTQGIGGNKIVLQDLRPIVEEIPRLWGAASVAFGEVIRNIEDFREASNAAGLEPSEGLLKVVKQLGATAKGANMDTYAAQMDILIDRFTRFKALLGKEVLPVIISMLKVGNQLLQFFNSLPAPIKSVTAHFIALTAALATMGSGLLEATFIIITFAQFRKIVGTVQLLAAAHVELFAAQSASTASAGTNTAAQTANSIANAANTQATVINTSAKAAQGTAQVAGAASSAASTAGIGANTAALLANAAAGAGAIGKQSKVLTLMFSAGKFLGRYVGWIGLAAAAVGALSFVYGRLRKPAEEAAKANEAFAESVELVNRSILDAGYLKKRSDSLKVAVDENKKLNDLFGDRVPINLKLKQELQDINAIMGDNADEARTALNSRIKGVKEEIFVLSQLKSSWEKRSELAVARGSVGAYKKYQQVLKGINEDLENQIGIMKGIELASKNAGNIMKDAADAAANAWSDLTFELIEADFILKRLEKSFSEAGKNEEENFSKVFKDARLKQVSEAYSDLSTAIDEQLTREIKQLKFQLSKVLEEEGEGEKFDDARRKSYMERYKFIESARDKQIELEKSHFDKRKEITKEYYGFLKGVAVDWFKYETQQEEIAAEQYAKWQNHRTETLKKEAEERIRVIRQVNEYENGIANEALAESQRRSKREADSRARQFEMDEAVLESKKPDINFGKLKTDKEVNEAKSKLEAYHKELNRIRVKYQNETIVGDTQEQHAIKVGIAKKEIEDLDAEKAHLQSLIDANKKRTLATPGVVDDENKAYQNQIEVIDAKQKTMMRAMATLERHYNEDSVTNREIRAHRIALIEIELQKTLIDLAKIANGQIKQIDEDALDAMEKRTKRRFDLLSKAAQQRQKSRKDAVDAWDKWLKKSQKTEEKALKESMKLYDKLKNVGVNAALELAFEREKSFVDIAKTFIKQSLRIIAQHYLETAIVLLNNKKKIASNTAVELSNNKVIGQLVDLKGLAGAPTALSVAGILFPKEMGNLLSGIGNTASKGLGEFGKLFHTRQADNAGAKSAIQAALGGSSYNRQDTMTNSRDFGRVLGPMLRDALKDTIPAQQGGQDRPINITIPISLEGRLVQELKWALEEKDEQHRT